MTFNNIALLGYQSGQFKWAASFLTDYGPALHRKHLKDALAAARGIGAYYEGDYSNPIRTLTNHKFGPAYQLRIRLTVICACYESLLQGDDINEELRNRMGAFTNFLYRNTTLSERAKAPYQNHLRLLKSLVEQVMQPGQTNDARTALREEIK